MEHVAQRGCGTSILEGIWLDWTQPGQPDLIRPALSRGSTKWPLEVGPSQNYDSVILLQEAWVCFRVVHTLDCHTLDICGNVFEGETHLLAICDCWIFSVACSALCFLACFFAVAGLCGRQFRPVWINRLLKSQPVLGPPATICI